MTNIPKQLNLELIHKLLFDENLSGWIIEQETGYSRSAISKLRKSDQSFEKVQIKNLVKIQNWIDSDNWRAYVDLQAYSKWLKTSQ